MKNFRLLFPEANKAALLEEEYEPAVGRGEVLVKALVSTVSPGTERANITGNPSVAGQNAPKVSFPRQCGYSVAGEVVSVGEGVTNLKPGDKVIAFWGKHDLYRVFSEKKVMKIDETKISVEEAAALFIATFPLGALRKTRVEIGEAALVMGCGLLGQPARLP